ncbi:TPA: hypothetical protein N0F65_009572 [Lagenidium giganteum]|uniref:Uncharacterized protein n=1 Tax=Lagenidium giganteum TaxID=4803 RepID=A0AAV2YIQ8_9STRA|nr:TPA: hypothetical protein N0F65_009572 [Lagenidium giganteum]
MAARKAARKASGNGGVIAFATVVGAAFFSVPFAVHFMKTENYNSSDKPLTTSAIRRGVYMNTGSKDVGVDKDWDFETNTWNGRRASDVWAQRVMAKRAQEAKDREANSTE